MILPSLARHRIDFRIFILASGIRLTYTFVVLILSYIFNPYDTSSTIARSVCGPLFEDRESTIPSLHVWDTVFFASIATCGYEFEQNIAFFPVLPGVLRLTGGTGYSSLAFSHISTVAAALCLFRLSHRVLADQHQAILSTLLFVLNPASVFFTAAYTEAVYSLLTWAGLLLMPSNSWLSTLLFTISAATRSNGILNAGFVVHEHLRRFIAAPHEMKQGRLVIALTGIAQSACIAGPFLAMQVHAYSLFCKEESHDIPGWCLSQIPASYSHVQAKYWNNGFLKYFQTVQAPNFLLATPILIIAVAAFVDYLHSDWWRHWMGLRNSYTGAIKGAKKPYYKPAVAPHVCLLAFLTVVAIFFMNVQVATRLLASLPAIYWFGAQARQAHRFLWAYFLSYSLLGALLFGNFYPWT
eukprot:jgi/Botrbrau1/8369/Bobra.0046s0029.1